MEPTLLKTLAQVAGIGGISLGVLLLLFRDIIRKNIFPKFRDEKLAYRLLRLIVVVVWSVAIAGIGAWVYTTVAGSAAAGAISITHGEFSGDIRFDNARVIVNQYQKIQGEQVDEEMLKRIERSVNLVRSGIYEQALPLFQEIAGKLNVPAAYNNLGALYAVTQKYDDARKAYTKALALDPEDQEVHLNLGLLEEKQGRATKAIEHFHKAQDYVETQELIRQVEEKINQGLVEAEPNDDIRNPNLFPLDKWVQGAIASKSDADYFKITTPEVYRDIVKVELHNEGATLKPRLGVYYDNKEWLGGTAEYLHLVTAGQNLEYAFSVQPNSVYFVSVIGLLDTRGSYQLKVTPLEAYDDYEPNDTIFKAKPVSLGSTIDANIMDQSDADYYRIKTSSQANSVTLFLENQSTSLKPRIAVYSVNKEWLRGSAEYLHLVTAGQNMEYTFSVEPNSVYYIYAGRLDGRGDYRLTLTEKSEEITVK